MSSAEIDLNSSELYINRELSLLEFNRRVLAQAKDKSTPLLERLRFLCISSSNMDEFFEVRVAALKQQIMLDAPQAIRPDGMTAPDVLTQISETAHQLVEEQYELLNKTMIPALAEEGIHFLRRATWNEEQREWLRRYFIRDVMPVLSPLTLDPAHPFPKILNKSLCFAVSLYGKDAFGRRNDLAVVRAPRVLPRLIELPDSCSAGAHDYVFLSSIIHEYVGDLFPGMQINGCYQFRVTRNSDMYVAEEEIEDLSVALSDELLQRNYGSAVRLEVADNCPKEITQLLLRRFLLTEDDLYQVAGPVNLSRVAAVCSLERPELTYPAFTPGMASGTGKKTNMFNAIRQADILLHHPYESFFPVLELLRQASKDAEVLAIKQTLYRTGADSFIADCLVRAAQSGKEVTAVVELRARFDEAANIKLASRLEEAGVQVVYGVVGYKTHAKMLMVVRREGKTLRRYCHLGTGNYHTGTVRAYTDLGLLSCSQAIGDDVHRVFQQMTGSARNIRLKRLLSSPFTLHSGLLERIAQEAEHARNGKPARIIAKMNGLSEATTIKALYEASQAGVQIDLIVRGICCLRPGIEGVSDNIRVRAVIGRFLEHSRVVYFGNDDKPELYFGSADWMDRNLLRRVETYVPLDSPKLFKRVFSETLDLALKDNMQSWELQSDGSYSKVKRGRRKARAIQTQLMEKLGAQTTSQ